MPKMMRKIWIAIITFVILTLTSLLVLGFSLATFFRRQNLCMQYFIKPMAKLLLSLVGVRVEYIGELLPTSQSVFISNHYSALDILIICSLGLPNTHYFLSVSTLKYIFVAIIGWCTNAFFIAEQTEREKRKQCFILAEKYLRNSGHSVFLTPEGKRNPGSEVQAFNKGAFHLAFALQAPIVSLCIITPDHCNPRLGYSFLPGKVKVVLLAIDQTKDWKLSELEIRIESIRARYLAAVN